jgi:hypothetical protein
MNLKKVTLPLILGLSLLFAACTESTQTRDNSEDAGEAIENAVEDSGNAVEKGLNDAGEAIEEAGDSVKDATN